MSLREDFEYRVSLLNDIGVLEITPRLISLLKWMNDQPSIKKMLDDLKASSHLTPVINGADPERHKKVARSAASPGEIVVVGLWMMEGCNWPTGRSSFTPLYQVATVFDLQPSPGSRTPEGFTTRSEEHTSELQSP